MLFPELIVAALASMLGFAALAAARRPRANRVPTMIGEALSRLAAGDPDVRLNPGCAGREARLASLVNALAGELANGGEGAHKPEPSGLARVTAGTGEQLLVLVIGIADFAKLRQQIGSAVAHRTLRLLQHRIVEAEPAAALGRLGRATVEAALPVSDGEHLEARLLALKAMIDEPIRIDDHYLELATAIGYAVAPQGVLGEGSLVERAELALDRAMSTHAPLAGFDDEDEAGSDDRTTLTRDLGRACDREEFFLCYQPKLSCRDNHIVGVEALIRWQHPTRGLIAPDQFIKLAEATGAIRPLTLWVIERAIADQRLLAEAGHDLEVAINISGRLLGDGGFAEWALEAVSAASGPICFEITETSVIDDRQRAVAHLDAFAQAGIRIAIDDYGSGLSSLAYLKQLPAHELKVDKQFVSGLASSHRDPLLVRSTIDLAHSLGLTVTAEGVDSPASLALLRMMGCDTAQGYLISRPVPLAQLLELLARQTGGESAVSDHPFRQSFWRTA